MLGLLSFGLCASIGFQLSWARNIVRRAYVDDADGSETAHEEKVESGNHCVVWGDWSFEGKKFNSKEEAGEYFKQKKRTELAAIQLDGSGEVNRFMSKRLTRVDWTKMKSWCGKQRDGAALVEEEAAPVEAARKPTRSEARVRQDGALPHHAPRARPDVSVEDSALFEVPAVETYRPRHSKYNPVTTSLEESLSGATTSLDAKASTLSGKVTVLEKEFTSLTSKVSSLLKSIGADDVTGKGASILQGGHGNKLKSRLAALEEYSVAVLEKTNVLETELFGTTAGNSASSPKSAGHSFKVHIEALAAQADELKSRLSALESTPLLGEAAKLEDVTGRLGSKASHIFTSIGVKSVTAPASPAITNKALKARLGSLEEYVADVQRNAAKLEYEILGNSWNLQTSSDSQKAGSIKDHAASLGEKLHDLDSRLSALASAPIASDVEKMEDAVTSLASRAAAMSKNVGLNDNAPTGLKLAHGAALSERIISLGEFIQNMQTTTVALEEELTGAAGNAPAQSQKDTLKSKVAFLELQVENMNSRISTLEQQV